jgi:hypothetical protein
MAPLGPLPFSLPCFGANQSLLQRMPPLLLPPASHFTNPAFLLLVASSNGKHNW